MVGFGVQKLLQVSERQANTASGRVQYGNQYMAENDLPKPEKRPGSHRKLAEDSTHTNNTGETLIVGVWGAETG